MSGKPGMKRPVPNRDSGRARMWKIIRRRMVFSLDDLVIPLDGVNTNNALKFVHNLCRHGIVRFDRWNGTQGTLGCCKVYRLINNTGPLQPMQCPTCKQSVTAKQCGGES
jgi:hypothetical protein